MMEFISLNGKWILEQHNKNFSIAASVPGCVHLDLLNAGKIPDPFYRKNEIEVRWISNETWIYKRDFIVSASFLNTTNVLLVCHGLQTFATIKINGRKVASTNNAFRIWEFDVKRFLRTGVNSIEIRFDSVIKQIQKQKAHYCRPIPAWKTSPYQESGGNLVRQSQCNFGWDWGPTLATCGIWRDIELLGFDTARITDVFIRQHHSPHKVRLEVTIQADCKTATKLLTKVLVQHKGQIVASTEKFFDCKQTVVLLEIENPRLWWPNKMGKQPLYEVTVDLLDKEGELLDTCTKRIGLRTLQLIRKKDKWGESFYFSVNGVPFFAKGANWIPADALVPRVNADRYRALLESAASANMNMLRVWGGGIYEDDDFYNLCDELGICIWQDFMFACATYPTFDNQFMKNVRQEAIDNIRRLRHHPCIALWCGNNELEQGLVGKKWTERTMSWTDYSKLFDTLLPSLVHKFDPDRAYWPGSPHSPRGKREDYNNPRWGDAHLWEVWHGRKPFHWYRTCFHRFCSEFGFQSFPERKTVNSYITAAERNITHPVMEHHQRNMIGNSLIISYMLDWFRMPKDFNSILWLSQILQSIAIKLGVEHWRRNMQRCMGSLYWQLNDCWPVASWSSIDYYLRWKALHYAAKKFFAPVLISGTVQSDKIDLFVTNDKLQPFNGIIRCIITTVTGEVIEKYSFNTKVPPTTSMHIKILDVSYLTKKFDRDNLLIWLELYEHNRIVSDNLLLLVKPKQLELRPPEFSYKVSKAEDSPTPTFDISIKTKYPALWTWLELKNMDAQFSDNFFHIRSGVTYKIKVCPVRKVNISELQTALKIRSLIDTYA